MTHWCRWPPARMTHLRTAGRLLGVRRKIPKRVTNRVLRNDVAHDLAPARSGLPRMDPRKEVLSGWLGAVSSPRSGLAAAGGEPPDRTSDAPVGGGSGPEPTGLPRRCVALHQPGRRCRARG